MFCCISHVPPAFSYDVNGDRSGQGGPTPLLRQQLLGGTPAAMSTAGASGAPRSSGTAAGTPLEVKALRDEVDTLRLQVCTKGCKGTRAKGSGAALARLRPPLGRSKASREEALLLQVGPC